MKKPKKITAAKTPARRTKSTTSKPRAKSTKTKTAESPKKAVVKRVRKLAAKMEEIAPPTKPVPEVKAPAVETAAKTKRKTVVKSAVEVKPPAKTEPLPEVKPVAKISPVPEVKPATKPKIEATPKPVAEKKPVVEPASPVSMKPADEPKPVAEAKPKARAKPKAVAKPLIIAKPADAPKPAVAGKPPADTKPPVEKPAPLAPVPPVTRAARPARKAPARIPSILLEGDKPGPAHASGPGQRYALGPKPSAEKLQTEGELPESYGTGAILLTARDPHWLYTHWDLSGDQQRRYNAFSRDGHMAVRVYVEAARGKPVVEVQVHPESRHWFVHVDRANTRYVAELGYYSAAEKWTVVSTSAATITPPDAVSTDTSAEFSTIPFEVPMEKLLSLVKEAVKESAPLAQALQELRAEGHGELPPITSPPANAPAAAPPSAARGGKRAPWKPAEWTPAQERALAEVVSMDHVRRVWMGSLEITELIRRQLLHELASMTAAELGAPAPGAPTSPAEAITGISSPGAKTVGRPKGFWFNVNAELIVYGATEVDATVSIGGRKIKLRPDGSFSYRFALPDGNYEMPVVAISADQTDGRAAEMKFGRHTEYRGDVGAHPQDPSLQQLLLENF
jgi:hypothetical protein